MRNHNGNGTGAHDAPTLNRRLASAIDGKREKALGAKSALVWDYILDAYTRLRRGTGETGKETARHLGGPIRPDEVRRLFAYWLLVDQTIPANDYSAYFIETGEALELVMESFGILDWWKRPNEEHIPDPLKTDRKLIGMLDAEPDRSRYWRSIRDLYADLPLYGINLPRLLERWGDDANDAFAAWLRITALRQPENTPAWAELHRAYELVEQA